MSRYGELIDESTVRFDRLLPGPIERVWRYLTDGAKRALWLAGGDMEAKVGGRIALHFHNASLSELPDIPKPDKYRDLPEKMSFAGKVIRWEPPNVLAHTWEFEDEHSEVSYELEACGDTVCLILIHRRLPPSDLIGASGGWHTHLDILRDVLGGTAPKPFWKTHMPLENEYAKRFRL